MRGRVAGDGRGSGYLRVWLVDDAPDFDANLCHVLANVIEAQALERRRAVHLTTRSGGHRGGAETQTPKSLESTARRTGRSHSKESRVPSSSDNLTRDAIRLRG